MLTCDAYHTPTGLNEGLALWAGADKGSRLIAGATDILPWAREGRAGDVHLPALIDVTRIAEMDGHARENGRIRIGANVVYQDFLRDDALMASMPCMPQCAIWFADDQIREAATLMGNIVNASPAADGTPAVVALNGEVELARLDGGKVARRRLPITEFILGPGKTALADDEIATAILVDDATGYGGAFRKVGLRRSLVISVACCAALVKTDKAGKIFEDVRLGLGGIAPVPCRLGDAEAELIGKPITAAAIRKAASHAAATIASRSRREYRREVIVNFVIAALEDALAGMPGVAIGEVAND